MSHGLTFRLLVTGPHKTEFPVVLERKVDETLTAIHDHLISPFISSPEDLTVIEGGAMCVDTYARIWALRHDHSSHTVPADWKKYGRVAGPYRNRAMLALDPHLIVAISDVPLVKTRGTRNMVHQAQKAGYPVLVQAPETSHLLVSR